MMIQQVTFTLGFLLLLSCHQANHDPLFRLIPGRDNGIDFSNDLSEDDSFNIIQYLYFYNGGGVAVGDINNDDLPDIYLSSNQNANALYLNAGQNEHGVVQFVDITREAGVAGTGNWNTGVSFSDINGDGWLDIYLCTVGGYKNFTGKNQLYINQGIKSNGAVAFIDQAQQYGVDHMGFSTQSAFLDFDRDGDLDMYLLCHSVHSSETYRDTGSTRIRDVMAGDKFFKNKMIDDVDPSPVFSDISDEAGIIGGIAGYGLGIGVSDFDKNGYPDIYVGNDFHENDFLYLNQGDGTFQERGTSAFGHTSYFTMGVDIADINNDLLPDILTLDMKPDNEFIYKCSQGPDPFIIYRFKRSFGYADQFAKNALQVHQGISPGGHIVFSEVASLFGIEATDWSWSSLVADYDLDGWKDVHITNGILRRPNDLDYLKYVANENIQKNASDLDLARQMPTGGVKNRFFKNFDGSDFRDMTEKWCNSAPSYSSGAAYGDFDLDGDLDLVINNVNRPASYLENTTDDLSSVNYLQIRLRGPGKNIFGIGAKVSVYTENNQQYSELFPVKGWQSSVEPKIIFGLGQHSVIDKILVEWPNGVSQKLENIRANQCLTIEYDSSRAQEHPDPQLSGGFNVDTIPFRHREDNYDDSNSEPLIPYLLSTQGPRIAAADVNGDGREDLYIGGAAGQTGQLFIQEEAGALVSRHANLFEKEAIDEEIAIIFVDIDRDNDKDLYVGIGGNKTSVRSDRVYVNDGQGIFFDRSDLLPSFVNQTSCVASCDFDKDGDQDLFVGSRSIANYYGKSPDSYLLINDGSGHFLAARPSIADLEELGMVTDAVWTDLDSDGDQDILVVGDWMPITIIENKGGAFVNRKIDKTEGLWNKIVVKDIDDDGDPDFIAGNFGTNNSLRPDKESPLHLYIADFDKNYRPDPVITYIKEGNEYPIAHLDLLSKQLIYLKKKYRSYQQFSTQTIGDIFDIDNYQKIDKKSVHTFSSVIGINDGNGNFQLMSLPEEAQRAPVYAIYADDFNADGRLDLYLGGNLFDAQPLIGRMDASYGILLLQGKDSSIWRHDDYALTPFIRGQIRDLKSILLNGQKYILVARNNDTLLKLPIAQDNL